MKYSKADSMNSTGMLLDRAPPFTAIDANVYHGSSRDRGRTAPQSSALRKSTRLGASATNSTPASSASVIFSSGQGAAQLQQSSHLQDSLLQGKQAKYWSESGKLRRVLVSWSLFDRLLHCSLFDAGSKGVGLKATEDIQRGSFVLEYIGESQADKPCSLTAWHDYGSLVVGNTTLCCCIAWACMHHSLIS